MTDPSPQVRPLDGGYAREARSLLYHACRHEPTYAYLFEAERAGFDQRVRAGVRELVRHHFAEELPALGLLIDDRLAALALIVPPQRRLEVTESWPWRLRMLLGTGARCTRRVLDYLEAVQACLPPGPFHTLPLWGVHPRFQGGGLGERLLRATRDWCAEDAGSQGLVIDTGNPRYLDGLRRQGYATLEELAIGPVRQYVLIHSGRPASG